MVLGGLGVEVPVKYTLGFLSWLCADIAKREGKEVLGLT
jgi:hypothetical protein